MSLLNKTIEICKAYDISPSKTKGQNFLINEKVYDKIIETANLTKDDTVLEVGPGLGFLTSLLSKNSRHVTSVELDDRIVQMLEIALESQNVKNVDIINEDILNIDIDDVVTGEYNVVSNLPYNITSIFLRKFLTLDNKPKQMVLLLQKEVVERIIAAPPQMSILAISVQYFAEVKIIEVIPAKDFWPAPKIDSAIIKISIRKEKLLNKKDEKQFFRLVKVGFSSKRKMLKNNLSAGFRIEQDKASKLITQVGFNEKIRAQELTVKDWLLLFVKFKEICYNTSNSK